MSLDKKNVVDGHAKYNKIVNTLEEVLELSHYYEQRGEKVYFQFKMPALDSSLKMNKKIVLDGTSRTLKVFSKDIQTIDDVYNKVFGVSKKEYFNLKKKKEKEQEKNFAR